MREMKDSGIAWVGAVPSNWDIMANKYLMKKIKVVKPTYEDEDILSLTVNGVIVRDLEAGGKMPASFDGYQTLYPGNLLMCLFDYDVTPRCIGLIKNNGVTSPAYSQFVMKGHNVADYSDVFLALATGIRVRSCDLRWNKLSELFYPIPPLEEQKAIVAHIDDVIEKTNAVIADKKAQLETLDEYKKSLIFEYVTGKKEVPIT